MAQNEKRSSSDANRSDVNLSSDLPSDLPSDSNLQMRESIQSKPTRLRFIDMMRGFVMFFLAVTSFFPPNSWESNPIVGWFSSHPDYYSTHLTLYDLGTPAFIFIIGLSFSLSFQKHVKRDGFNKALLTNIIRYGALMFLGLLIIYVSSSGFTEVKSFNNNGNGFYSNFNGLTLDVIIWDVIPAIALSGLGAIPFVLIKDPRVRAVAAYVWMFIYPVLFQFTPLRAYATLSVHGGIFGTAFTFVAILTMGSVIGDYLFHSKTKERTKYINIFILGVVNVVAGFLLSSVPGWEATKHQGSFSYGLIAIGISTLGLLIFAFLDKKLNWHSKYLAGFGQNPFLVYFLVEIPDFLLKEFGVSKENLLISLVSLVLVLLYISLILRYLQKHKKIITTEKATMIFILFADIVGILLIVAGMITVTGQVAIIVSYIAIIGSLILSIWGYKKPQPRYILGFVGVIEIACLLVLAIVLIV